MLKHTILFAIVLTVCAPVLAQAPHTQTAREALIEMLSGTTPESFERHLLKETALRIHQLSDEQRQQFMMSRAAVKSGGGQNEVTWFGEGPVLVSYTDPRTSTKFDVVVAKDEPGDGVEDLEFSFRSNGDLQKGLASLIPRLLVTMKQEDEVWKLAEIGFSMKVKLDAALLDTFTERLKKSQPSVSTVAVEQPKEVQSRALSSEEAAAADAVRAVVAAETSFKRAHPETGYTCSIADLGENLGSVEGYRVSLLGCRGIPGTSFKVMAVPEGAERHGRKSFCADEKGVLKFSDDGRGLTCLTESNLVK